MKRNLIGILSLVVMSVLLSTAANAQAYVKADVPFGFKVGSAQLPAGTYEIKAANDSAVVIRNPNTRAGALAGIRREPSRDTRAKLIFHHVAGQYFLAEIWRGAGNTGMVLPPSKQEKALEKELRASGQSGAGEDVMVAVY